MRILTSHRTSQKKLSQKQVLEEIRKISKSRNSLQNKIDKTVTLVAHFLNMDVCSCYVTRPGDVLELYASYGLEAKSVHNTFLRTGEGLVGEIALQRKPLSFNNAWEHASFVYKPETGENRFNSLAGVPLLHQERLLGVLIIQQKEVFQFTKEIMLFLDIIAMVTAEILFNALKKSTEKQIVSSKQPKRLDATALIAGLAIGKAFVHKRMGFDSILASNKDHEHKKLAVALKSVEAEVNQMLAQPDVADEQAEIFKTYLMFTQDKGWINKINQAIDSGLTAQAGVQKVLEEMTARMALITDPYIKERIHDLQDLAGRLIRHLHGKHETALKKMPKNTILVAHNMGPVELLDYDTTKIKGLILEEGSQTMHVVIVARSLNIPVISGIKDITNKIVNDDMLAIDADKGFLYLNPSDEVLDEFDERLKIYRKHQAEFLPLKNLPATTKDGVSISLNINAGLAADLMNTKGFSFDGIGLFRTELPFMSADYLPDTQEQTNIYRTVLDEVKDKPVIFRSLDIGSDKILPYFENTQEQNPAMGWRSVRITLDRRAILKTQLRAFIRAARGKELQIMFPMITTPEEFKEAKETLFLELEHEKERGTELPTKVLVGSMIEVPSLLFQLEDLAKLTDFISIGSNDLAQFFYATDRGNPIIWNRYEVLSPAFLKALKKICDVCKKMNIPCSICGEMASRPLEAFALVALGFTKLSMNPASLGRVKAAIRTMNQQQAHDFLQAHLNDSDSNLRTLLKAYAIDHGVII